MATRNELPMEDGVVEEYNDGINEGSHEHFSQNSAENMPVKEDRIYRKAKRTVKIVTKSDEESASALTNGVPITDAGNHSSGVRSKSGIMPFSKNSRKSRNTPHGRGQPKKGEIS